MKFDISTTGFDHVNDMLRQMPTAVTHKVLGQAHAAAAKILVQREKLLAPEGPTGNLIDSIGSVKTSLSRAGVIGEVITGPRKRYKGAHAHLVEFGTRARRILGKGKYKAGTNRGIMTARPFVRRAFAETRTQIVNSIGVNILKVLDRTIRKALKK